MAIRWDKLTVKSQEAMQQAIGQASELGNPELQPVHLLLTLISDREGVILPVLEKIGVATERLEAEWHSIEEKLPRVSGAQASQACRTGSTRPWNRRSRKRPILRMSTSRPNISCSASPAKRATLRWMPCWPRARRTTRF